MFDSTAKVRENDLFFLLSANASESRDSAYERGNIKVLIAIGKCNALFRLLQYCLIVCSSSQFVRIKENNLKQRGMQTSLRSRIMDLHICQRMPTQALR